MQNVMTVKKYLEEITDPDVKKRALKNLHIERRDDIANSLEHALFTAFLWHKTPEKFDYWKAVHHNVKYPENKMPVPEIK